MDKVQLIIVVALMVSECAAAVAQLLAPENKGVSGILAGVIKVLQALNAPKA